MNIDWNIFESIKEYLYISDIESHETIYMNQALREALGYSRGEGYPEISESFFASPALKKMDVMQDTIFQIDGRSYRLGILSEGGKSGLGGDDGHTYTANEIIVNECLQYALQAEDYETTFTHLLSFIGIRFRCERVYIFETNPNNTFSNTYEWCASGVSPQKELLQNEPIGMVECWMEIFRKNQLVIIEDLEQIRNSYPHVYAALKPQEIRSLAVCPLRSKDDIIGFLGIDNPEPHQIPAITSFFRVIEYFVVSFMKRRDLSYRLEYLSYHDQLTGALNRSAYKEKEKELSGLDSLGVLFGDITGLKRINDQLGHIAGDHLIRSCYEMLCEVFGNEWIYRTGGDEFVVICPDITEDGFRKKCVWLREIINKADCHLATGYAWSVRPGDGFQVLVNKAEAEMYRDKEKYYCGADSASGRPRDRRGTDQAEHYVNPETIDTVKNMEQYLRANPDAIDLLIHSVSLPDSPVGLYFGDLQTNLYYVSDNIRDMFGFESNVIYDMLTKWEKRICYPEDLELFRQDIREIWRDRQKKHDFKYRVYDKDGNRIWIHCRGVAYWDDEKEIPDYFVGCVSRQEFLVDYASGFPGESAAARRLKEIQEKGQDTVVLGIGLNQFSEINGIKGREEADRLLQDITLYWDRKLSHRLWFYRLGGIKFIAILKPGCTEFTESAIREIRECARSCYSKYNVPMEYPCSICVFQYPFDINIPEKLIEKTAAYIEAAKNNIEKEYIAYREQREGKRKSQEDILASLKQDVANGFRNFRIVIQPVVSALSDQIIGGEILLRWCYMGEDISPAVFIPLLEKKGLISQVGRWVFGETVRHCRRIVLEHPQFQLTFNVSHLQIWEKELLPYMEQTLRKYGMDGSNLMPELTERYFEDEPEKLAEFVAGCKRMGMSAILDDFGGGYSAMEILLRYPADVVKLDRMFLCKAADDRDRQNLLNATVFACHQFGKLVCLEGAETWEAVSAVKAAGGDMIQGYYYYHPLELNDFYEVMSQAGLDGLNGT